MPPSLECLLSMKCPLSHPILFRYMPQASIRSFAVGVSEDLQVWMQVQVQDGMSVKVQCLITSYGVHVAVSSGHPTTVFFSVQYLYGEAKVAWKFSIAWGMLKISSWSSRLETWLSNLSRIESRVTKEDQVSNFMSRTCRERALFKSAHLPFILKITAPRIGWDALLVSWSPGLLVIVLWKLAF